MKQRNKKFNSLQLNKVKVSQILGGITDPDLDGDGEKETPKTGQECSDSNADCQATDVRTCNPR